jgi:uncharacterized membrane protein YjfL (UPF0719 family)
VSLTEVVFIVVAALVLLALARWILQWMYGRPLRILLTEHDNPAVGVAVVGYLFGALWTIKVLLGTPSQGFWRDVAGVLLYGALGLVLLTVVAMVSCRLFLGSHVREQLDAHNVAAAIVVAAVYVATSLTYSGALDGEGGGFWVLVLFFVLGQLALLGITYAFRWLTGYNDVQEIAAGNVAAALALAGLLVAVGVVVGRAAAGTFTGFLSSFGGFVIAVLGVVVFYPVRQLVVQSLILGGPIRWHGTLLDSEIAQDRNIAAGLLEAVGYLTTALFVTYMI